MLFDFCYGMVHNIIDSENNGIIITINTLKLYLLSNQMLATLYMIGPFYIYFLFNVLIKCVFLSIKIYQIELKFSFALW